MKVHYNFDDFGTIKNPVVTTGSFDGVHVGHRVIIDRIKFLANAIEGESVLITFYPHPRKVLFPEDNSKLYMINTQAEKQYLLANTGLDHLFIINFTLEFSKTPSDVFVKDILLGKLNAKIIVVGFNHHFGHNRAGDYNYLYELSQTANFRVEEIPQQDIEHEAVSSTRIRKALIEGKIGRANAYLYHPFFFKTKLVECEKHKFDKFNCFKISDLYSDKILPPNGRYAAKLLNNLGVNQVLCDIYDNNVYVQLPNNLNLSTDINNIIEFHKQIRSFENYDDSINSINFTKDVLFLSDLIY